MERANFAEIVADTNISVDDFDVALSEALFCHARPLSPNFEIVETNNPIAMKSGNVFSSNNKEFLTDEEISSLVEYFNR